MQSVALRLLAEREAAIEAFKPDEWWTVDVTLTADGKPFKVQTVLIPERLTPGILAVKKLQLENQALTAVADSGGHLHGWWQAVQGTMPSLLCLSPARLVLAVLTVHNRESCSLLLLLHHY